MANACWTGFNIIKCISLFLYHYTVPLLSLLHFHLQYFMLHISYITYCTSLVIFFPMITCCSLRAGSVLVAGSDTEQMTASQLHHHLPLSSCFPLYLLLSAFSPPLPMQHLQHYQNNSFNDISVKDLVEIQFPCLQ